MPLLLQLLSSLVDAAERLRQFSPVKQSISCAVLEEVRWRLFRVVSCVPVLLGRLVQMISMEYPVHVLHWAHGNNDGLLSGEVLIDSVWCRKSLVCVSAVAVAQWRRAPQSGRSAR
jgi:hypothetical protein